MSTSSTRRRAAAANAVKFDDKSAVEICSIGSIVFLFTTTTIEAGVVMGRLVHPTATTSSFSIAVTASAAINTLLARLLVVILGRRRALLLLLLLASESLLLVEE
jgi:hypothetical protein